MHPSIGSIGERVSALSVALLVAAFCMVANAQQAATTGSFQVTSTTFSNGGSLPQTTAYTILSNGANICTPDGSPGGDQSPELAWTNAPKRTVAFVVVAYDATAAFTHWGMYNIPASTTELPENAGVAGSSFGQQIVNDFFAAAEFDGPCPPANVAPNAHRYIFTVYALDEKLILPSPRNFPASAETLYHALIAAGRDHHILGSASVVGTYSATP